MHSLRNKLSSKSFFLECRKLKNSLPTAEEICDSILSYAIGTESEVVFLSTEMPVRFYLDGTVYTTQRGGTAGGPLVLCFPEP